MSDTIGFSSNNIHYIPLVLPTVQQQMVKAHISQLDMHGQIWVIFLFKKIYVSYAD